MHPTRSDVSRKENGHDVRADHSQNHYANEQHLTPLESRKLLTEVSFAQDAAPPKTKAECKKAKGTWDATKKECTLPK